MCKFLTDLFKKTDEPLENVIADEEPEAIEETIEEDYNSKNTTKNLVVILSDGHVI